MARSKNSPALIADLGAIIEELDKKGRLVRVRSEVDPRPTPVTRTTMSSPVVPTILADLRGPSASL